MIATGPAARTFTHEDAYTVINRLYQDRGWTDGLPIVPPTDDAVAEFIKWTDRDRHEIVAALPPRQGEATIERIAINAVMAGCRPEYFPLIVTAIEAGGRDLVAIAVVADTAAPVVPCGACRQFLAEFNPDLTVLSAGRGTERRTWTLSQLLPYPRDGILGNAG